VIEVWIIIGAILIALIWLYLCVRVGAKADKQIKEMFSKKEKRSGK
jgi:uncharacterized membrane protein YciS (DUF1049 family)